MNTRWIISLVLCASMLTTVVYPVSAALTQGNFIPCGSVQSVPSDSKMTLYSVRKGDTLWDISRKYNVDLKTLQIINNLDSRAVLAVGQVIEIPYNRSRVHTIAAGDTLWDIASKYDTSIEEVLRLNGGVNPKNLKIGQKLVIPGSTGSVAVASTQASRGYSLSEAVIMAWPAVGQITSPYGWRASGYHHGIDIAGDTGTTIKAAAAGKVTFAGYKAVYGKMIIISHPDGKETVYAHAQKLLVGKGEYVVRGQPIATIGLTGRTTGPHVHFEVRVDGKAQNPLKYLRY